VKILVSVNLRVPLNRGNSLTVESLVASVGGLCWMLSGSLWDLSNVRTPNSGSVSCNRDLQQEEI
jgi:hypothetical protein